MAIKNVKRLFKNILAGIFIILVFIQFIRPAKNINNTITPQDIAVMYPMPDSVHAILQKACYDCHSNTTRYPWYNNIQPVAFWLNNHVRDGKKEINFSEFGKLPLAKQVKKLKKTAKEVEGGGMPLNSYLWIHKDAVLSENEKNMLIAWANGLAQRISVTTPATK